MTTEDNARSLVVLGMSPCPNDTFMFHAMIHDKVATGRWCFQPTMEDIERLNVRAARSGESLMVTKMSVAALAHVTETYRVLHAGAALGRGVGPILVRAADRHAITSLSDLVGKRVAVPGERTTAYLLLKLYAPPDIEALVMPFDQIMLAVAEGRADAGVVIHEGRFTYRERGLAMVADLGRLWELDVDLPLPLGVIAVKREIAETTVRVLTDTIRASIEYAQANPDASWPWIREHSQEMSEDVCRRHIALYVNEYSLALGDEGRQAIEILLDRGRERGVIPDGRCLF